MSHPPKKGITIYAPESDYDSETIKRLLGTFLSSQKQVMVNIHTPNKSQFNNLMKKGKEALKTAVGEILTKHSCVIFVIDRDGPMAHAARKKQSYSIFNQIHKVLEVKEFQGRVHLVEAMYEIEAWLLIDCVGIFCYFAKGHHSLPAECKQHSVECSPECREQIRQKFKALINSYQKDDTQTIEEPVAGGKGVKEYLQHFAKEIYKLLHKGDYSKAEQYKENKSPEIARYIEINSETLKRNESLERFIQLIIQCMLEAMLNEALLEYLVKYKQDLIQSLPVPSNYKEVEAVVHSVKIAGKEVAVYVTGEMKVLVEGGSIPFHAFPFEGTIILDLEKGKVLQKGEELRVWAS